MNDYETIDAELANPRWLDAETLADQLDLDDEPPAGLRAVGLGNSDAMALAIVGTREQLQAVAYKIALLLVADPERPDPGPYVR